MSFKDSAINFFLRSATGSRKLRIVLRLVGVTVYLLFTSLFVFMSLLTDRFLNLPELIPEPLSIVLAIPLMLAGAVIYIWAVSSFIRLKGISVLLNPPTKVLSDGPYSYCRHPMIGAIILALLGLGILLRSVSLVFVFTPLFALINAWELKEIEEPELTKRLGSEYIEYKSSTPMFIPRFGSGAKKK